MISHYLEKNIFQIRPNSQWASGIIAPFYCDNRQILSEPQIWKQMMSQMIQLIQTHSPDVEGIAAVATGGIAHAAYIAAQLSLPMVYIRPQAKDHGKKKLIEGKLNVDRYILIEDLISTASSSLKAVEELRSHHKQVLAIYSLFEYQLRLAQQNLKQHNIQNYSVIQLQQILAHLNPNKNEQEIIDQFIKEHCIDDILN